MNWLTAIRASSLRTHTAAPLLVACLAAWLLPAEARSQEEEQPPWVRRAIEGRRLMDEGRYTEAEELLAAELVDARRSGSRDVRLMVIAGNLALTRKKLGEYAEAEPLYRLALGLAREMYGDGSRHTGIALDNLANLYQEMDEMKKAEPLRRKALAVFEKALGPDAFDTVVCVNNLADTCRVTGKSEEAERLYLRALAAAEKLQGKEHPFYATTLDNLGGFYAETNELEKAKRLREEALAILERTLGVHHPEVGVCLANLGQVYILLRQYEDAEPILTRALEVHARALGSRHPGTAFCLEQLAAVYANTGREARAEEFRETARMVRGAHELENARLPGERDADARGVEPSAGPTDAASDGRSEDIAPPESAEEEPLPQAP